MKKLAVSLALVPLALGSLTGCSFFQEEEPAQTTQTQEDNSVLTFSQTYVETMFSTSSNALTNVTLAGQNAVKTIGSENSAVLQQNLDAVTLAEKLTAEQQKSLAEIYTQANPMSNYMDTSGMTDTQIFVVNNYALATLAIFARETNTILAVKVPESAVRMENGIAWFDLSKVSYDSNKATAKNLPSVGTGAPTMLPLKQAEDGSWKVSGLDMYQVITGEVKK